MRPTYNDTNFLCCYPTGETATDLSEGQHQTFQSLDKNYNVSGDSQVWNQAREMCMELQPRFTKEDFLQLRGEWSGTWAKAAMVSQQAFIVLLSPRLLFPYSWANWGLYEESGVGSRTISDKDKTVIDSWVYGCAHAICLSLCSPVCQFFHVCPYAHECEPRS